ncbi:MAG TPA: LytTR family DNA-binding domain-containing protein [Emticicia sp.]
MNQLYLTRRQQIATDQIVYLESESNYTCIYTTAQVRIVATLTLGSILERLDTQTFLRVNRSHILNLSYISTCRLENNKLIFRLQDGQEFTASRRRLRGVQKTLNKTSKDLSW